MLWAFGWGPDYGCLSKSGGPPFSTTSLVVVLRGTRGVTWEFVYFSLFFPFIYWGCSWSVSYFWILYCSFSGGCMDFVFVY